MTWRRDITGRSWNDWNDLTLKEVFLNKKVKVVTDDNKNYVGICTSLKLVACSNKDQATKIITLKDALSWGFFYGEIINKNEKKTMTFELDQIETIQSKGAFYKNNEKKSIISRWFKTAFQKRLKTYSNQKISVLCNRYTYRGVLSEISNDYIILSDATAVERSGASGREQPVCEDPINGTVLVMNQFIELIFQPKWCLAPLPNEPGYPVPTISQSPSINQFVFFQPSLDSWRG